MEKRYGSSLECLVIELERLIRRPKLDAALPSSADRLRNMLASAWGMTR